MSVCHNAAPPGVSIHATPAGGDMTSYINLRCWEKFLSTPPSRVATVVAHKRPRRWVCFYPRHPRGWRRNLRSLHNFPQYVSIHATLAGGDSRARQKYACARCFYPRHPRGWRRVDLYNAVVAAEFLSTPPSRVATSLPSSARFRAGVSIHATLAGGDHFRTANTRCSCCFYPRHPRGWRRPSGSVHAGGVHSFYPRHPRGWRRPRRRAGRQVRPVSIHATLAGGDYEAARRFSLTFRFLSTPPSRVATRKDARLYEEVMSFYPRHPRGWRLAAAATEPPQPPVSIHATLAGGDVPLSALLGSA